MKVLLALSGLVLVVVSATWAYRVNYATQATLDRVAGLRAEIVRLHEAVSVLEAEWAYLNRPDRLRTLAALHDARLGLVPLAPEAYVALDEIPFPPDDIVSDDLVPADFPPEDSPPADVLAMPGGEPE